MSHNCKNTHTLVVSPWLQTAGLLCVLCNTADNLFKVLCTVECFWFLLFVRIADYCCAFTNANITFSTVHPAQVCGWVRGRSYQQLTCSHGVDPELWELLFTHTSRTRRREAADFSVHLGDLSGLHSCAHTHTHAELTLKSPTSGTSAVTRISAGQHWQHSQMQTGASCADNSCCSEG